MSNGIYPSYVGPTVEYRYNSLYPSWVRGIIGDIPVPEIPEWLIGGGVIVLENTYGVLNTTAVRGFRYVESLLAAEVLSNTPGVAMVTKVVSVILFAAKVAATQVSQTLGFRTKPPAGAEVTDKEPGVDD